MARPQQRLSGLPRFVRDNELHIRASLKSVYKGNTFSYYRSLERQEAAKAGAVRRNPRLVKAFHDDWANIDDVRASVACVLEQFRARVWALGEVFHNLPGNFDDLYHLTFANTRDRRSGGALSSFNPQTYMRRLRTALKELLAAYPDMWALGIVEISAVEPEPDRFVFEPHFHVIVGGVPEIELRRTFNNLLSTATKGSHGLMLKSIRDTKHLGRTVSYLFKFEPELRTKFLTAEGRVGKGRSNRLTGKAKNEWLSWAAAYRIDELLIAVGLRPNLIREFKSCGLQHLILKLLRGSQRNAG
ncbi:hypothetical protein NXC14_CH03830 [Rhizobium sp. NXC14]|uniref:hypothetical protein n=1 Tax=Rhizobium sp. NXC14 TaxID=1981173 RepID=UPI000A2088E2|nr:hypothetical protein [Rhizobium sp. NXC14]ARO31715.1 hypothetical protein NXC14_CH03830 [Rhizobium sp. NXC14]